MPTETQSKTISKLKDPKWTWAKGAACQRCKSARLCHVLSVAEDKHYVCIGQTEHCDYLPEDLGIGGAQDIEFDYCLDCGQIQHKFPLSKTGLEQQDADKSTKMGPKISSSG